MIALDCMNRCKEIIDTMMDYWNGCLTYFILANRCKKIRGVNEKAEESNLGRYIIKHRIVEILSTHFGKGERERERKRERVREK